MPTVDSSIKYKSRCRGNSKTLPPPTRPFSRPFCGYDLFALLLWLKLFFPVFWGFLCVSARPFLLGERVMLALLSVLNEGDVVNPVAAMLLSRI
jgi:hypothetical protein